MKPNPATLKHQHAKTLKHWKTAKLFSQGAEAKIYLIENPRQSAKSAAQFSPNKFIQKIRTEKSYRHPQLDNQIRTRRTKSEAKILTKAISIGASVPRVISSDKYNINIEYINGNRLSETLNSYPEKKQFKIMQQLGKQIALLHKNNIIHSDLTTSNTILQTPSQNTGTKGSPNCPPSHSEAVSQRSGLTAKRSHSEAVYLIDFGLSFISQKTEDKAVDIHLLKQALEAKHFQNHESLFKQFLKTYKDKQVIERLKLVEKRGRYKH